MSAFVPDLKPLSAGQILDRAIRLYRAWQLARRRFWWLFGFFMLLILFNLLVVQGPLTLLTTTLLYFDVRVRTEGFDLAVLAASNNEAPLDSDQEVMRAPEPESAFEFTSTEVGYFCLISLGIGGIILVFSLLGSSATSLFTRLN